MWYPTIAQMLEHRVAKLAACAAFPIAVGHFAGAASLWALWMSAWLMTGRRQKACVDAELVAL